MIKTGFISGSRYDKLLQENPKHCSFSLAVLFILTTVLSWTVYTQHHADLVQLVFKLTDHQLPIHYSSSLWVGMEQGHTFSINLGSGQMIRFTVQLLYVSLISVGTNVYFLNVLLESMLQVV